MVIDIAILKGWGVLAYAYYAASGRAIWDFFYIVFNNLFYLFLSIGMAISSIYLIMTVMVLLTKNRDREWRFEREKAPFVTVQIPTKNEIIALRCARKCLDFDYPRDRYEILIGDDSDDKSVSMELDKFAAMHQRVRVTRRKENTGFKPGNLNNMLKYSKGEIIVIFDSDFIPERDFLKRIVTPFMHDKKISAVQARWKFINADRNMVTVLASTIVYTFHHVTLSLMKRYDSGFLCGSAEAIRKSDLVRWGGWKSSSLTEDIEYALRIHKNGKKIYYLPGLECYNEAPSRPIDLYKQQMRWAHGVISSYKTHAGGLVSTQLMPARQKLLTFLGAFGYLLPIIIVMTFVTGAFSIMTHRPAPMEWGRFFSELSRNIVLTSGLLIASAIALYRAGKIKLLSKMLLSSFSIGLVTTYYVNIGILKALRNKSMEWYLLNKSSLNSKDSVKNRKG